MVCRWQHVGMGLNKMWSKSQVAGRPWGPSGKNTVRKIEFDHSGPTVTGYSETLRIYGSGMFSTCCDYGKRG